MAGQPPLDDLQEDMLSWFVPEEAVGVPLGAGNVAGQAVIARVAVDQLPSIVRLDVPDVGQPRA